MFQGESTPYTFNPKSRVQPSFASNFLNYESKGGDLENTTQTRKNEYQSRSRNTSLDDSQEITKRMDMLKRTLGLPIQDPNYSDDHVLRNYLSNHRDLQQSLLHGLGQSSTKKDKELSDYLNLDEDSAFQTDSKSQLRKGLSPTISNQQRSPDSKVQDVTPYKLSVSEDVSPYREQSFEKRLENYAAQGMSFKGYNDNGKEARTSMQALQRENELLRAKLDEERTQQQDQQLLMNAHLEEYRRTVAFDKESEELLKQNITFYKSQIQEYEKQIMDLRAQTGGSQHGDKSMMKTILAEQEQFKAREQTYLYEIETLKKELHILHQQDMGNPEHSGSGDTYLRKLEMNIKFLNSQIKELTQDKSHLQTLNENLQHEIKTLSDKLYVEIEDKYRKEIDEKDFLIKSLKRDFEIYMEMDEEPTQRAFFRKTYKKKLTKTAIDTEGRKTKGPRDSDDDVEGVYIRLNQLENENFLLKEKLDFLELQSKGSRNSREGRGSHSNNYEAQMTQRRVQTLKDLVVFWKEKSEKLVTSFYGALKQLRVENEMLKESLLGKVNSFEEETEVLVKKIKKHYKKEQLKVLELVNTLEEKHYQNQAKLAEARSKYKTTLATFTPPVRHTGTGHASKRKTKTRHETIHFSP